MSELITTRQAAEIIGCTTQNILNKRNQPHLGFPPAQMINGVCHYDKAAVLSWHKENTPEKRKRQSVERMLATRDGKNLKKTPWDSLYAKAADPVNRGFLTGQYDPEQKKLKHFSKRQLARRKPGTTQRITVNGWNQT